MFQSKEIRILGVTFIMVAIIIALFLDYSYKKDKQAFIDQATEQFHYSFNAIQNTLSGFADFFVYELTTDEEVIHLMSRANTKDEVIKCDVRDSLYSLLNPKFELLKTKNIKQLQFHLPDNESFLRFHSPERYGDNLTNIRHSVKMTNINKEKRFGFESGKIFNGFRFVAPLFNKNKHIGSVEASFSLQAIKSQLLTMGFQNVGFMVKKSIIEAKAFSNEIDRYAESPIYNNYFCEKEYLNATSQDHILFHFESKTLNLIHTNIDNFNNFSVYQRHNGRYYLITFLGIKNLEGQPAAYIYVYQESGFLEYLAHQKRTVIFFSTTLFIFIWILIFFLSYSNIKINNINKSLIKSEEKFRTVADFAYDWEYWKHIEGHFVYISPSVERITGYAPEVFYHDSHKLFEIIHPDDREKLFAHEKDVIENTCDSTLEFRIITKSNKIKWISHSCKNIYNEDNEVIGFRVSNRDETEKKVISNALKNSELKYRSLAENASMGIVIHTNSQSFKFVNQYTLDLLSYKNIDELSHKSLYDIFDPAYLNRAKLFIDKVYQHPNEVIEEQFKFLSKDGKSVYVTCRGQMVDYEEEKTLQITFVDISELKKTERELRKAIEKAELSDKLKSAILQNMSHEIRTPLNGIIGFSGLLVQGEVDFELQQDYLEIIHKSSHKLLDVISDILAVSQIESGQQKVFYQDVIVAEIIKDVFRKYEYEAIDKNISFQNHCHLPDSLIISTDKQKLTQILNQLVSNAIKFTEKGNVQLHANIKSDEIEFKVSDTGIGIDGDIKEEIFNSFRQVELSETRNYGGTGLGLSICKGLIELLKGKISIDSEIGKGSVFTVSIPCKLIEGSQVLEEDQIQGIEKKTKKPYSILLVEDESSNAYYLTKILKSKMSFDCEIELAENGVEAIQKVRENFFDIILMDIKMPVLNGIEATKKIKSINPKIPIIAQSAYTSEENRERALLAGCIDYITKPISPRELEKVLLRQINKVLN